VLTAGLQKVSARYPNGCIIIKARILLGRWMRSVKVVAEQSGMTGEPPRLRGEEVETKKPS
jgi:hypothetical protein